MDVLRRAFEIQSRIWAYICWSFLVNSALGRVHENMIANLLRIGHLVKPPHLHLAHTASLGSRKTLSAVSKIRLLTTQPRCDARVSRAACPVRHH